MLLLWHSRNITSLQGAYERSAFEISLTEASVVVLPTNITPSLVFSAATATPSLVFSAATAIPSFALDNPFINTSILAELLWRDGPWMMSVTEITCRFDHLHMHHLTHHSQASMVILIFFIPPSLPKSSKHIILNVRAYVIVKEGGTASSGWSQQLQSSRQAVVKPLCSLMHPIRSSHRHQSMKYSAAKRFQ